MVAFRSAMHRLRFHSAPACADGGIGNVLSELARTFDARVFAGLDRIEQEVPGAVWQLLIFLLRPGGAAGRNASATRLAERRPARAEFRLAQLRPVHHP